VEAYSRQVPQMSVFGHVGSRGQAVVKVARVRLYAASWSTTKRPDDAHSGTKLTRPLRRQCLLLTDGVEKGLERGREP
jgi:hypothetical protein